MAEQSQSKATYGLYCSEVALTTDNHEITLGGVVITTGGVVVTTGGVVITTGGYVITIRVL